jgi:hypothetical protein
MLVPVRLALDVAPNARSTDRSESGTGERRRRASVRPVRWLSLTAVLCVAAVAAAEPVQLEVSGECPSRAQIEAAFAAEGIAMDAGGPWTAAITSSDGRADLSLLQPPAVETNRSIGSRDCAAIAEAFALIVAAAGEAPPAADLEPRRLPPPVEPPGVAAAAPLERDPRSGRRSGAWLSVGVSGGLEIAADHSAPRFWELDGVLRRDALRLRLAVSAASWSESQDVERRQLLGRLEAGRSFGRPALWLRSLAGLGAAVATVRADASDGVEVTRLLPAVTASLVGGVAITDAVSLRAEAGGVGFPIADRYVTSMGVAGRSPRVQLRLGVGLELRTRL